MNLIANGYQKQNALQKAVETATASIQDFGIFNIKTRIKDDKKKENFER